MICSLTNTLVIYIKLSKIRWWWMKIAEYFYKLHLDVVHISVNRNFIACKIIISLSWKLFVDIFSSFVPIIKSIASLSLSLSLCLMLVVFYCWTTRQGYGHLIFLSRFNHIILTITRIICSLNCNYMYVNTSFINYLFQGMAVTVVVSLIRTCAKTPSFTSAVNQFRLHTTSRYPS